MPIATTTALLGAAAIGGATSMIAGGNAADAQRDAASQASAASERATQAQIAESARQYDLTRADWAPYRQVGYGAVGKLASMYGVQSRNADGTVVSGVDTNGYNGGGDFETSPGYQFRMSEGLKALDRAAAARGSFNSGGQAKARMRYAQGVASDEYNTYANRLAALAGVGQSATGSTAAAGATASGQVVNALGQNGQNQASAATAAGNARASSYANTGSAINGTVNNLASMYLYGQNGGFGGGFGGGGLNLPAGSGGLDNYDFSPIDIGAGAFGG